MNRHERPARVAHFIDKVVEPIWKERGGGSMWRGEGDLDISPLGMGVLEPVIDITISIGELVHKVRIVVPDAIGMEI